MAQSPRILYIDDEADLLDLAASFFEDENLPIETCVTFNEALNLLRKNKYDLVISDARMPTGSGYEILKVIREEKLSDCKFILVTGNVENEGEKREFEYDLILFKPIHFHELIQQVKNILSL